MSAITKVLDRLARANQVRPGQWMAACPICQSKNGRPVAIKATDDGRVLIHGFCGHETGEIVGALGLSITDLFDRPLGTRLEPTTQRVSARDALDLIDEEVLVASLLSLELANKGRLTDEDQSRLATAAARIGRARDLVHGK